MERWCPSQSWGWGFGPSHSLEAWCHLHQAQTWVSRPGEFVDDGGSYTWGTMLAPPKLSWEVAPIPRSR